MPSQSSSSTGSAGASLTSLFDSDGVLEVMLLLRARGAEELRSLVEFEAGTTRGHPNATPVSRRRPGSRTLRYEP